MTACLRSEEALEWGLNIGGISEFSRDCLNQNIVSKETASALSLVEIRVSGKPRRNVFYYTVVS